MSSYVLNPYESTQVFGKGNLVTLFESGLSPTTVKNFYSSNYNLSYDTWAKLFGSGNAIYTQSNTNVFKPVKSLISSLNTISNETTELLTADITMQIMFRVETALNTATNAYKLFKRSTVGLSNTGGINILAAIKPPIIGPNPKKKRSAPGITSNPGSRVLAPGQNVVPTPSLHDIMQNIYEFNFSDGADITLYELQSKGATNSFSNNKILFTSRLGPSEYGSEKTLEYMLTNANIIRNGRSLTQYASEFAIEMLQNSSLQSFMNVPNSSVSASPLSCGFAIIKDPKTDVAVNIRIYCSYVLPNPLNPKQQIAISSGVNLFDVADIANFREGVSSSNFAILLSNICLTLNGDTSSGFTETNTRWEFGAINNFNKLKCITSDRSPYWNGQFIKDCYLHGSTIDIPKRMYNIIQYLNENYSSLENGQMIVVTYADGTYKIVSMVKIIIDGGKTTFQCKDARIDTLFPIKNVKSDMLVTGELQIQNYKGDTLMHVDPVTNTATIMGKLGINQELHEVHGMVDIDNLSNRNMKNFIDQFSPLILDTIENMDTFITRNPYATSNTSILNTSTATIMALKIYNSEQMPSTLTRDIRFAKLQARIELPVRMFAVIDAYKTLYSINDQITNLNMQLDQLHIAYDEAIDAEADAKIYGIVAEVAIAVVTAGCGIGISKSVAKEWDTYGRVAVAAMNITMGTVLGLNDISNYVESLTGLTSEDLEDRITETENQIAVAKQQQQQQQSVIDELISALSTQADVLGLGPIYADYLNCQVAFTSAARIYVTACLYTISTINDTIAECNKQIDDINAKGTQVIPDSIPIYVFKIDSYLSDIDACIENMKNKQRLYVEYGTNFRVDKIQEVRDFTMSDVIAMHFKNTMNIQASTYALINDMKNNASYTTDLGKSISFLYGYMNTLSDNINAARSKIINQETAAVLNSVPTKPLIINPNIQDAIDTAQFYYDEAAYYKDAYTWLLAAYGFGAHASAGDHHNLISTCLIDKKWTHEHHLDDMIGGANSVRPKFGRKSWTGLYVDTGYGDILNIAVNGNDMKLNQFSQWANTTFSNLLVPQSQKVSDLKSKLDALIAQRDSMTDELQDYTSLQNWDATTHNTLRTIISNLYKMCALRAEKTMGITHAYVLPVTTIDDNVTSILYLKISLSESDTLAVAPAEADLNRAVNARATALIPSNADAAVAAMANKQWITDNTATTSAFAISSANLITLNAAIAYNQVMVGIASAAATSIQTSADAIVSTNAAVAKAKQAYDSAPVFLRQVFKMQYDSAVTSYNSAVAANAQAKTNKTVADAAVVNSVAAIKNAQTIYNTSLNAYNAAKAISDASLAVYNAANIKAGESKTAYDSASATVTDLTAKYNAAVAAAENPNVKLTLSGRSLNVDEYTRDASYRETLVKLINALTAATQLVNYSCILYKTNNKISITEQIKTDFIFNTRFDNGSLFVTIDDITNNKVVQSEQFTYWNNCRIADLFLPGTNIRLTDIYAAIDKQFIAQYGFDPIIENSATQKLLENTFIIPYKFDDNWRIAAVRYVQINTILYRVWSSILVNEYISQSIIAKGDSTFYGDITVKSADEQKIFHVDTLNKTTTNMYPLGIGTHDPATMLDINDTSINNVNHLISSISSRMNEMQSIYSTIVTKTTNADILSTMISSETANVNVTDDYMYVYEMNMNTRNANDVRVVYNGAHPKWNGYTYNEILSKNIDPDRSPIIEKYVLPTLQESLDEALYYHGSIDTTLHEFTYGLKYSINRVFIINDRVYIIGCGWNLQHFKININYNQNIADLFDLIEDTIEYLNYVKFHSLLSNGNIVSYGSEKIEKYIGLLSSKNAILSENIFVYTLSPATASLLDHNVSNVTLRKYYNITIGSGTAIHNMQDTSMRQLHTSFIVQFAKYYNDKTNLNDFGILSCQNNNNYYYVAFFKLSPTELLAFYVNMTDKYIVPSVSVTGDMSISGEFSLYTQPIHDEKTKYITIDPTNSYMGINTNERFINYTMDYTTTSSAYNTKHHVVAFSRSYPNVSFERVAEVSEDPAMDVMKRDYSKFSSYSASTMVRVSELWNYAEIMDRVGYLNGSNASRTSIPPTGGTSLLTWDKKVVEYNENHFDWRLHKTYGPDISFEIKDKTGVSTELGEVKMVIDHIDANHHIHAGFGVQVVDTNLSKTFDSSVKNLMYVNNQKELFIDGVWLGGKLLRAENGVLMWGDNKIFSSNPE